MSRSSLGVSTRTPLPSEASSQSSPDIAEAPDGSFVVVWSSYVSAGDDPEYSIQMRRLASEGTPMAADLQVNSYTSGYSYSPNAGVANDGPSTASGGTLTIPLPAGLSFVSSPVCTEDAGTVTCAFGSLPPMASGEIPFALLVDGSLAAGTMLPLTETVTENEPDGNGANDSDSITLTVAVPLFANGLER